MKTTSKVILALFVLVIFGLLIGCNEAERVTNNLSKEADNFNVVRRVTVINNMTDTVLLQLEGKMSIDGGYGSGELHIIVENEDGTYSKQIIGLNNMTTYTVEQIGGLTTNKYAYRINFNPKMVLPLEPAGID